MAETNTKLESLQAQCANRALHRLSNFNNRRPRLRMFAQLSVMRLRPRNSLPALLYLFGHSITPLRSRLLTHLAASANKNASARICRHTRRSYEIASDFYREW